MQTCECGVLCTSNYNLERHRLTRSHELNLLCGGVSKQNGLYECNLCNYSTLRKDNFRKHVQSAKHQSAKNREVKPEDRCLSQNQVVQPVMLIEVMELFLNHMKHETDSQKVQQTELFKTFADRIVAHQQQQPPITVVQTAETMTNTNNNQKFNLNVFLNEECKNAMNMNEFIQRVNITSEDLEHLGEVGYTDGMSKILTKAMRGIDTTERPMHCTDTKRETIYVRKDDAWKKDDDCEETKRLITHIAHKNYKALTEWRNEHPEHTEHDTADYEAWYSISRNMCNTDPAALKKLIRHLALTTAVEKNGLITT